MLARLPRWTWLLLLSGAVIVAAATFLGTSAPAAPAAGAGAATPAKASSGLPPIKHVFVIVLENEPVTLTFGGTNPAPYLSQTMVSEGAYLPNYYGIGHNSLDNYIAMISGQAPNPLTQNDCGTYQDYPAGDTSLGASGQYPEQTCVYPTTVTTIANQLDSAGLTWGAYEDSMPAACEHPPLGGAETYNGEPPGGAYATRHDPFMYFHSIIDNASYCNSHVVNLSNLAGVLLGPASGVPNYVFITPDVCDDGHDTQATCETNYGRDGGFMGINDFLSTWVPQITASAAFKQDGLLIVTFDETSGGDDSACCNELPGPAAGGASPGQGGPGGGDVGAVLLSRYITGGTVANANYNHYSMLGTIEDIFGLCRLGYAQGTTSFGGDVFTNAPGTTASTGTNCVTSTTTTTSTSTSTSTSATTTSTTMTSSSTTTTSSTTTSTPAKKCVLPRLPKKIKHHKLPAGVLVSQVAISKGHSKHTLTFTALRATSVRVQFKLAMASSKTKKIATLTTTACHGYSVKLPASNGTVTITASTRAGAATIVKHD